jgi:nucleotide-binding universal stress UspA family protein
MYKKLVVPVDGSKPADKALDHAMHLAKTISVMYKLKRSNTIYLLSARKKKYESHRTRDNNFIIRVEVLVSQGNSVSDTIIKFANKEKANLIVVGNIGLSGISKLKTLGSVSRSIAEKSSCPVLIVH